MTDSVRLLGVMQGLAFQERKGSAFYCLFNELMASGCMDEVAGFEIPRVLRKALLLSNFSLSKELWKVKDQLDVNRYGLASWFARKAVSGSRSDFNSILQIGSDYRLGRCMNSPFSDVPLFSFHDNNFPSFLRSLSPGLVSNNRKVNAYNFEKGVYEELCSIFTMSNTLRNSFVKDFGLPEDKVIYAGFGSPFVAQDVSYKDYSTKNILFVASHSFESKGGKDLLGAFRKVRRSSPDVTLTLVGRDWGIDEPGVKCIGFLDKRKDEDLRKYRECFGLASLFVLPSHREAFGEVFIEAMSFGLPCIGSNAGVMPELIEGNNAGFVVKPGDQDELAKLILDLINSENELRTLGYNGLNAVDSEYQWSTVTSRISSQVKKFI